MDRIQWSDGVTDSQSQYDAVFIGARWVQNDTPRVTRTTVVVVRPDHTHRDAAVKTVPRVVVISLQLIVGVLGVSRRRRYRCINNCTTCLFSQPAYYRRHCSLVVLLLLLLLLLQLLLVMMMMIMDFVMTSTRSSDAYVVIHKHSPQQVDHQNNCHLPLINIHLYFSTLWQNLLWSIISLLLLLLLLSSLSSSSLFTCQCRANCCCSRRLCCVKPLPQRRWSISVVTFWQPKF